MVNLANIHMFNYKDNNGLKPLVNVENQRSCLAEMCVKMLDNDYKILSESGNKHQLSNKAT
jgi:hypothetical protein